MSNCSLHSNLLLNEKVSLSQQSKHQAVTQTSYIPPCVVSFLVTWYSAVKSTFFMGNSAALDRMHNAICQQHPSDQMPPAVFPAHTSSFEALCCFQDSGMFLQKVWSPLEYLEEDLMLCDMFIVITALLWKQELCFCQIRHTLSLLVELLWKSEGEGKDVYQFQVTFTAVQWNPRASSLSIFL